MLRAPLLALLALPLLPGLAWSGDPEWGASSPGSTGPSPRCVIFYEGSNCDPTQGRSSCCTEAGPDMEGCWENDEARSMKVYGGPGTVLTAFDDPNGRTRDDYFVIVKQDHRPVCVGSFDEPERRTSQPPESIWFYSGGDGLDGKISTFRWVDPRQTDVAAPGPEGSRTARRSERKPPVE